MNLYYLYGEKNHKGKFQKKLNHISHISKYNSSDKSYFNLKEI